MANSDFGDRTLPPTERRRREARQRGEVARSPRLTSAFILLAASCLFWMTSSQAINATNAFLRKGLTSIQFASITIISTTEMMRSAATVFATVVFPLVLLLLISGAIANLAQVGWLWVPSSIAPRFRGPSLNWGGRLADTVGFILRMALLGCVTWRFLWLHEWPLRSLSLNEPTFILTQLARMMSEYFLQLSACLVLLGLIDYGYCFWRNEQGLKMTIEELRHEQREDSINPQIRKLQTRSDHGRGARTNLSEVGSVEPTRVT